MKRSLFLRMAVMLLCVGVLFGLIFGFKIFVSFKIKEAIGSMKPPAVTVSTGKAQMLPWQPQLNAVGTVRAVRGVDLSAEVAGLVRSVDFHSGSETRTGALLVQLNADPDVAQLIALQASAAQAEIVYERDRKQFEIEAISKAQLDNEAQDLKSKRSQVDEQAAQVAKKTIRAPFAGRLGITTVQPGQYLNPGDKIVTLQQIDRVYVDFFLPQRVLGQIAVKQPVRLTADAFEGQTFNGRVSAIDPKIDSGTRNLQIEALVENPKRELLPGMFVNVALQSGPPRQQLTVPLSAIAFNPYGATAFVVQRKPGAEGAGGLIAQQRFVTTGETRGDQVVVLSGISEGEEVVTSGQLKLKNGSAIVINNSVQPSDNPAPAPVDR
jgi:membrane fusion protein (multidrug efflux system)